MNRYEKHKYAIDLAKYEAMERQQRAAEERARQQIALDRASGYRVHEYAWAFEKGRPLDTGDDR